MHIPDGYLGPQTYVPAWAVMFGWWTVSFRQVRAKISQARLPLLGIGAAFSFVVMMFNVPIPGGTTGHAVGAGLLAIMLGPWGASVSISVALVVQALLFGDGGITAIAANCLTMAVIAPWTAWFVYQLIAGASSLTSRRRVWAGAIGSYASLNASALATAILFGIQPMVAHTASGQPLYSPYPLWVSVPAMMIEHLLVFGVVEAAVTAAAVAWLQRVDVSLLSGSLAAPTATGAPTAAAPPATRHPYRPLWIALGVLLVLTPIGILLPKLFGAGAAWGEWNGAELKRSLGYVPGGFARLESAWHALIPDYAIPGLSGTAGEVVGYVLAGVIGIVVVVGVGFALAWLMRPRRTTPQAITRPACSNHDDALPAPSASSGRTSDFIGRTLAGLGSVTREAMAAERSALAEGWLQRTDARAKILAALVLIVAASLTRSHLALAAIYALSLVAAVSSRVSLGSTLKRVWLVVPLFTGLVLLPATLNIVTPGTPVLVLATLGPGAHLGPIALPPVIAVTEQGLAGASLVFLRVVASVGIATALVATTRWTDLLAGLRALAVPSLFIMVLEMAYRYVFVLSGVARDDFLARRSRTIVDVSSAEDRRFVAGRATGLFRRSLALSERVNDAMVSRGWTGSPRTLRADSFDAGAITLVAVAAVVAVAVVLAGRLA